MKQFVAAEDIAALTPTQKRALNNLWLPRKYDLAVTFICTDAEKDLHEPYVFVVAEAELAPDDSPKPWQQVALGGRPHQYAQVLLYPFTSHDQQIFLETIDTLPDQMVEEDFDPETFSEGYDKKHCYPLFNIGQMLEIIETQIFNHVPYNVSYDPREERYTVASSDWEPGSSMGLCFEGTDLCDALWSAVKSLF